MDIFGNMFAELAGDEFTPAQLRAMREQQDEMEKEASRISGVPSHMLGNIAQEQARRERRAEMPATPSESYAKPLPPVDGGTIDIPYEDVTEH